MHKSRFLKLAVVFSLLLCPLISSCSNTNLSLQAVSEVDFSTPQAVQVSYNEHIWNTTLVFKEGCLELNFTDEKSLMGGAYVCMDSRSYKITYGKMAFEGETKELSHSFLPHIIYSFLISGDSIVAESYSKEKNCAFTEVEVNGYFVILEVYEKDGNISYSLEIK